MSIKLSTIAAWSFSAEVRARTALSSIPGRAANTEMLALRMVGLASLASLKSRLAVKRAKSLLLLHLQ